MWKEIWEDLMDLGEYATRGFVEEVILGKDEYIPTYEKNRMANSMVNSARHQYQAAKKRYEQRVEIINQKYQDFQRLRQAIHNGEIRTFESYIASTSLGDHLRATKQYYFRQVPVKEKVYFETNIPDAPRGDFELYSPFLLFRWDEAEENYNSATELKYEIQRETEKLKTQTEALQLIVNRIAEIEQVFLILSKQLALINGKIYAIGEIYRQELVEMGMMYLSLLYVLMSTDIMKNGSITPESAEVLRFINAEMEGY